MPYFYKKSCVTDKIYGGLNRKRQWSHRKLRLVVAVVVASVKPTIYLFIIVDLLKSIRTPFQCYANSYIVDFYKYLNIIFKLRFINQACAVIS